MSMLGPDQWRARSQVFDGSSDTWTEGPGGLVLPSATFAPQPRRYELPIGVDLFAGAGGMSCGFHKAGFHVVAAAEGDPVASLTYLCNLGSSETIIHVLDQPAPGTPKKWLRLFEEQAGQAVRAGDITEVAGTGWIAAEMHHERATCASHIEDQAGKEWFCDCYHAPPPHRLACEHFYLGDVRCLTGDMVLEDLGAEVDCVMGGPPCQGFSTAGKRNVMDPRNSLVFEFARLVVEINPKTFIFENVPGIASMTTPEGLPVLDAFTLYIAERGYGAYKALLKSLRTTAGLGAAIRDAGGRGKAKDDDEGQDEHEVDDVEQLELVPS